MGDDDKPRPQWRLRSWRYPHWTRRIAVQVLRPDGSFDTKGTIHLPEDLATDFIRVMRRGLNATHEKMT